MGAHKQMMAQTKQKRWTVPNKGEAFTAIYFYIYIYIYIYI